MVFDNCAVLSQVSLVLKHAMRVRMEVSAKKRRSSQFFAATKSQRSGSFLGGGTLQSQFLQPVKMGHIASTHSSLGLRSNSSSTSTGVRVDSTDRGNVYT